MKKETSAGVIVFRKEKSEIKYLLLHYKADHWGFPKGHVEGQESLEEAALRETKEETGLLVGLKKGFKESFDYVFRQNGQLINKTVYFFIARADTEKVSISFEHKDHKWLSFDKALERITYKETKEVLKKAHRILNNKTLSNF